MKIYKKEEKKRSWCLDLRNNDVNDTETAILYAVDSTTGIMITPVIIFFKNGRISIRGGVKNELLKNYYDPYEHGNEYKDGGCILYDEEE